MKKKITIVDYGLGNIISAQQSFLNVSDRFGWDSEVLITDKPKDIKSSSHIVLPGQGAFKSCMEGLTGIDGMVEQLSECVITKKIPFLGICVGMQLLADESYENGKHSGLGWIKGKIKKLPSSNIKLPHMGWNVVETNINPSKLEISKQKNDFYFVHSYYFDCFDEKYILGTTDYGINFASIICKENIYGVQFHPEKSSEQGLSLIKDFLLL